jgi:hypothetical protein
MKMNSAQIEQTLDQFDGEVVPEDNPVIPQLKRIFGDHTYFLSQTGLNIVEPTDSDQENGGWGVVVNLANWTDTGSTGLVPHDPEDTGLVIKL